MYIQPTEADMALAKQIMDLRLSDTETYDDCLLAAGKMIAYDRFVRQHCGEKISAHP